MLFNSFVFWLLRSASQRYIWLTLTGYVFYGYWDPRFCLLMAFSTLVSFTAGLGFLRWQDPKHRKLCLVIPITIDLLLLGFFKYTGFLLRSVASVLHLAHADIAVPQVDIILPIGISFYTFHTITYIVDSYRGVIRPTRNLFEFSAYVSLFSQLVAGPIVRFRQIEQDLENLGSADRSRWVRIGISFFIVGLVEKVIVADSLAVFVDPAFAHYATLSTAGAWLAVLGYTFQLYFDFSGYSTMAVGLGYLFGLRIPQNFNSPYKALDPSDFWRRWHISLSSCLRDYLYIPLGGSRHGEWKTYRNLMLTMLIGGLWHGASWTFVIWGAYHGLLLAAYRRFSERWDALPRALRQGLTFFLVVIGWVFFRAKDFTVAFAMLSKMFVPTAGDSLPRLTLFIPLLLAAGTWAMAGPNAFDLHEQFQWRWRRALVLATALGACLSIMSSGAASPFLYFQF
jgi:alginate O-acetyltransferase complex protein AlgI